MTDCVHTTPDALRVYLREGATCSEMFFAARCNTWCEECGAYVCSYIGPCRETALFAAAMLPVTAWVSRGRINRDVCRGRFLPDGSHVIEFFPDDPFFFSCETIPVKEVA